MNTAQVRIDSEHRYFANDVPVPGFSEICKSLGVIQPNQFYTDAGRDEGSALSKWCHFLAQGQESDQDPDPRIAGRVEGFRKFMAESQFQFAGGEEPLYDPILRYCGTPDLFGSIGPWAVVIDVKRGAKEPWHRIQTAAYKIALAHRPFKVQKRYSLYLKDRGYSLDEHDDVADEVRWKVLVQAYHAKSFYNH